MNSLNNKLQVELSNSYKIKSLVRQSRKITNSYVHNMKETNNLKVYTNLK